MRRSQTQGATTRTLNRHSNETHNNETDDILDANDQEPYFGDLPYNVSKHCFRIGSINIDNLSQYEGKTKNPKDEHIFTSINNYELSITLMQEMGLNWNAVRHEDQWRERVKAHLEYQQTKSYVSHNTRDKKQQQPRQWGGTGILSYGKISHFTMGAGSDLAKLGRWTWARYRGKDGITLRCVSIYRPSNSKKGEETVYQQHKEYFQSINDDRCPRLAFLQDLESELTSWIAEGDNIIVSGDINDDIFSNHITSLFQRHNMRNLIFDRHDPTHAPTTYYRTSSNRIVDGMWATPNIIADRCGYLEPGEFPGNHSLLWADISYASALGHNPPNPQIPARRRLQLWNRKCTQRYLTGYKALERQHFLWERQVILENSLRYDTPLNQPQAQEAIAIDTTRTISMNKAEHKCRKIFTGAIDFSEATEMPKRCIAFWELAIRRRKGLQVSKKLWQRRKKKAQITENTAPMSVDDMIEQLNIQRKAYRNAKKKHKEERITFLDTLDPKDKDRLQRNEKAREKGRIAKMITGKLQSKSVTKAIVDGHEYNTKVEIEDTFKTINYAKIRASDDTAFLQEPLVSVLGYCEDQPADDAILQGTFIPPPHTDQYAKLLLQGLKQPPSLQPSQRSFHPRKYISTADHIRGWKRVKEKTSSGMSGLHFGMFKANIQDPKLADIDASIRSVAYSTGFTYPRWKTGLDVQLLKRSQDYRAEKQRTILLLEADYNMNNKVIGSDAMRSGERSKTLTRDNYGGRKNMRSNEIAMNSRLTDDSIWGRRGRAILMSNDAKGCYDRIAHIVVKLALQRLGIPKPALQSMLHTIQDMEHHIRTAYGDSDTGYKRQAGDKPPQGMLQGNGAGPAGWFSISTIIIEELKKAGYGYHDWTLIRQRALSITCFAFVDDTDLIHVNNDPNVTTPQLIQEAQQALDTWEGLLRATGGDLAPEKSYWYLVEVVRKGGKWTYAKIQDRPGDLTLKNGSHTIKRNEVHQAEEALGIQRRPDGQMKQELEYLKGKIAKWCDALRTKRIQPGDAWYCLNSTIMKTIEYPLMATTFTEMELKKLMSPLLQTALRKSHVQSRLPRTLVYGSLRARGLNIKNPYITQLIHHLQAILRHQARNTQSTGLHEENMDLVQIHIGSEHPFWDLPYEPYAQLAPDGWIKHTWLQLDSSNLSLRGEDITIHKQRENDIHLTDAFIAHGYTGDQLDALNDCRLHLRATTLADLCTANGLSITSSAWHGQRFIHCKPHNWINTYRPGPNKWKLWQNVLRQLFLPPINTHRHLTNPLGDWSKPTDDHWIWWIDPTTDTIYEHHSITSWSVWTRQTTNGPIARYQLPLLLHTAGWPTTLTRITALVSPNRRYVYFHNAGNADFPPPPPPPSTLADTLALLPTSAHWALQKIIQSDNGRRIAEALSNHTAIAVSDGSLKYCLGTAAFIIEAEDHIDHISGVNQVPGPITDGDSHRCEVSGIYSTALIIEAIVSLYNITSGTITMACDNDQSLKVFDPEYTPDPSHQNFDLVLATWTAIHRTNITWIGREVKGHQDNKVPYASLDRFEKLNVAMDTTAKAYWQHCYSANPDSPIHTPTEQPIYGEGWQIWHNQSKITRPFTNNLYEIITDPVSQYWWVRHGNTSDATMEDIHWDATAALMTKLPPGRRRWITKMASGECGVGATLQKWKFQDDAICPRCSLPEDTAHVFRCIGHGASEVWAESLDQLNKSLTKSHTDPDLQYCLIDCIDRWRHQRPIMPALYPPQYHTLLRSQASIGWENMLEGLVSKLWQRHQHTYYISKGFQKSSKRWLTTTLHQLHHLGWKQWKHRCDTKHITLQPRHQRMIRELNQSIIREHSKGIHNLLQGDRHHAQHNIVTLLTKPLTYKQSWLANITTARQRFLRIQTNDENLIVYSRANSRIFQWMATGQQF